MMSVGLGFVTSSDLALTGRAAATLLVPVGSTEQHGPHLPLDTDTRIAAAVADRVAQRLGRPQPGGFLVAPPIAYGASGEHQDFAGTVSLGVEALTGLLIEYGRSACRWAARVAFVNGHGGNVAALRAATARLRFERRDVAWAGCAVAGGDAHAGHTETSVLLHLAPEAVRAERAQAGNCAPLAELLPALRNGGVAAVSTLGVLGDPTTATATDGERILAVMTDAVADAISAWAPGEDGMLDGSRP